MERRALGIALRNVVALLLGRMALLFRVHRVAVRLVVPPGVAEIGRHHIRTGMHVAYHALARRNRVREDVTDGMAGLAARNRRIGRSAFAAVSKLGVGAGVLRRSVVAVNHMASRTAARAIVAGLIVRARQREHRIHEARLLQAKKDWIGAQLRAEAAAAQLVVGTAGLLAALRIAGLGFRPAATLEHAQHVARLRNLPALEGRNLREDAFAARLFRRRRRHSAQRLRRAVARVTFAETRVLVRVGAVVVKRGAPQQAAGRHHARLHGAHFRSVTARAAARLRRDAQIARIDEAHVFSAFAQPARVRALRIGRFIRECGLARQDMRAALGLLVRGGVSRCVFRRARGRIASMAIRAAQPHRARGMHGRLVGCRVAGHAASAFGVGFGLRLTHQARARRAERIVRPRTRHPRGRERQGDARRQRHERYERDTPPSPVSRFFRGGECVAHR